MGNMMTDPQVLGFLGRALSMEMTAVQQYLCLSRFSHLQGFEDIAAKFQHEAQEEMAHSERIISRMLVLGVAPNATQLRPARLGDSLPALIAAAQALEMEIINFYQTAVDYCSRIGDFDNRLFFEQLLQEEQAHANSLDEWKQNDLTATGRKT